MAEEHVSDAHDHRSPLGTRLFRARREEDTGREFSKSIRTSVGQLTKTPMDNSSFRNVSKLPYVTPVSKHSACFETFRQPGGQAYDVYDCFVAFLSGTRIILSP
jgi:hypothetical protein